jgi:hypothetical protein
MVAEEVLQRPRVGEEASASFAREVGELGRVACALEIDAEPVQRVLVRVVAEALDGLDEPAELPRALRSSGTASTSGASLGGRRSRLSTIRYRSPSRASSNARPAVSRSASRLASNASPAARS